jgi:hypothetical protein
MAFKISGDHFLRAANEIGRIGDNDTLPYDLDSRFIRDNAEPLSELCLAFCNSSKSWSRKQTSDFMNSLSVMSERLLAPAGSFGFRIVTRIHPFWNLYLNGLGVAIAEAHEPIRSSRVHSYRLGCTPDAMFDRARSWRAYKEATLADASIETDGAVVVQTDISSFYERVYHHRLENLLADILGTGSCVPAQIDRLLSKISAGRSFGLPIGGQCARVLAEVIAKPVDDSLTDAGIAWHRYVDDFTFICPNQESAYAALSTASHALADLGLSLNRTKTTILSAGHYQEYVAVQLGEGDQVSNQLRELDLYFDPYSDAAQAEYESLKRSVENIDIEFLLGLERDKSQPDAFVLAQISRSLRFQDPKGASQLCATLLDPKNLNAFRASWSKIMRGVYAVRATPEFESVSGHVDKLLDRLPAGVPHLLLPEANVLYFLRLISFKKNEIRGRYVRKLYDSTASQAVRRECIDCWRRWGDRANFLRLRNQWQTLGADEQRMLWLAAGSFGEEGGHARNQLKKSLPQAWRLGIESVQGPTFASIFSDWAVNWNGN